MCSSFTEKSLAQFVKDHKLKGVNSSFPPNRIDDPLIGGTSYFARVIEDGIGLPIHPFFYDVLESYGIAPGQLTPLAWSHMVGMLMIWEDLFQKTPSVAIRHHIYKLETVSANPRSYYVTCWPKVRDVAVTGLPSSCDEWRKKFFYLGIATCGMWLRQYFKIASVSRTYLVSSYDLSKYCFLTFILFAEAHVQRGLTDEELDEVNSTYRLSDRRYNSIRGDKIVKPDMKFKKGDPKLKALAAAENVKSATSPPTSPEVI